MKLFWVKYTKTVKQDIFLGNCLLHFFMAPPSLVEKCSQFVCLSAFKYKPSDLVYYHWQKKLAKKWIREFKVLYLDGFIFGWHNISFFCDSDFLLTLIDFSVVMTLCYFLIYIIILWHLWSFPQYSLILLYSVFLWVFAQNVNYYIIIICYEFSERNDL